MPRDSSVYLEDIVRATERIAAYVAGHTWESFIVDTKTVDAVVRNLEIVGEAVKMVPAGVRFHGSHADRSKHRMYPC